MQEGNSLWAFMLENRGDILTKTTEHLWLTGISVLLAIVVGVLIGLILTRRQSLASPVIGIANMIQTIPSIALLGFMIPLVGIGAIPAIIALFLYALLPIIRNTYTGILDVDPATKEAGRGLGMTDWQLLSKVELPLALPVIFAGIRTATVINVGVATLCSLIAAGGLGEFIFTGIALNNQQLILTGAIPAAFLAIFLDLFLGLVQNNITKWWKGILWALGLVLVLGIGWQVFQSMQARTFLAGLDREFFERRDGWPGLVETYDLQMDAVQMDAGLMYLALKNDKVDVIGGYATDGRIAAYNLRVLEDDQRFFPPYFVAPLVRKETLQEYPQLGAAIDLLAGKVNDEEMRRLNYLVDQEKQTPEQVARDYLESIGLEILRAREEGKADIVIGGKNFTEQFILAEMYAQVIESYTDLKVQAKTGLGGTSICFDALQNGDIDLYPEYTGTAFLVLLSPPEDLVNSIIKDRQAVYRYVQEQVGEQFGLQLMGSLEANNAYAIMMREEVAAQLGIRTITDLATYLRER
ncbi:MAG: ABC transporter permease/substrate-binding protein [Bacteroidota bacterium]